MKDLLLDNINEISASLYGLLGDGAQRTPTEALVLKLPKLYCAVKKEANIANHQPCFLGTFCSGAEQRVPRG